jgi:hypothetical protein
MQSPMVVLHTRCMPFVALCVLLLTEGRATSRTEPRPSGNDGNVTVIRHPPISNAVRNRVLRSGAFLFGILIGLSIIGIVFAMV